MCERERQILIDRETITYAGGQRAVGEVKAGEVK
jgi:hypothetical protein